MRDEVIGAARRVLAEEALLIFFREEGRFPDQDFGDRNWEIEFDFAKATSRRVRGREGYRGSVRLRQAPPGRGSEFEARLRVQ